MKKDIVTLAKEIREELTNLDQTSGRDRSLRLLEELEYRCNRIEACVRDLQEAV